MIPRNEPSLSSGEGLVSGAKINVIPSPAPEFGYCEILMVKVLLIIAGHASTGHGYNTRPTLWCGTDGEEVELLGKGSDVRLRYPSYAFTAPVQIRLP